MANLLSQHANDRMGGASSRGQTSRACPSLPPKAITAPETGPLGLCRHQTKGGLFPDFPAVSHLNEAGVDVVHGPIDCRGDPQGVQPMVALGPPHAVAQLLLALLLHQV